MNEISNIEDDGAARFSHIAIIGVGLIGSSLARVIRKKNLAEKISISSRTKATLERAKILQLGDLYALDPADAVAAADLVILCIPVGSFAEIGAQIAPALQKDTLLTDVGSTKRSVISAILPYLPDHVHFIPGHPIAGTEQSGPDAGFAHLFQDRWCILTPPEGSDDTAVKKLTRFWQDCGSRVDIMDADHHDRILAIVSHLPQLISYNMVGMANGVEQATRNEIIKYSASGFRDFTRLAASDPIMWRDVCLNNRDAILEMLSCFSEDLTALRRAIRWGDGDTLEKLFTHTREIHQSIIAAGIIAAGEDVAGLNFGHDRIKSEE